MLDRGFPRALTSGYKADNVLKDSQSSRQAYRAQIKPEEMRRNCNERLSGQRKIVGQL